VALLFLLPGASNRSCRPLTETGNILENNYNHVFEFPFIFLTDLKSVERETAVF
jgi:hypothetical protein